MILNAQGVLLIGEQGSAKTVTIQSYMKKFNSEEHLSRSFNFSSASTPLYFQVIQRGILFSKLFCLICRFFFSNKTHN